MRRGDQHPAGARGHAPVFPGASLSGGIGIPPRAALCAALVLVLVLAAAGLAQAAKRRLHQPRPRPAPLAVSVSADASHPGMTVGQEFLGLSFEVSSLRQIAGYAGGGDLVALLRSLGPGVLRFGGVSADTQVAWTDAETPRPAWALHVLEAGDLRELANLAAESGWHVLLTIGFGHYEPEAAAREAAAAKAALGPWLQGIELGNEPNAYALHGLRPEPWTFIQYDEQVTAYRNAIEAAAPGIPLDGPDTSGSSAYESWGLDEAIDQKPALLTGHHYPLGCAEQPPPSIERLLSPKIRQREGTSVRRYVAIARQSEVPFRMDETNSVSCGGVAGISNTFASALWATNYLSQAMSMGVSGVNLHGNPANCNGYSPVCAPTPEALAAGALGAQPVWYALLLARELIGERPIPASISAPAKPNVVVTAFIAPDGARRFVVVDDDPPKSRNVAIRLHVGGGFGGASILSLTAPSPTSLSGVRLGGVAVALNGTWSAPSRLPVAPNRHGVITVQLNPSNAALLTVSPASG
jgi:hypothetical protein